MRHRRLWDGGLGLFGPKGLVRRSFEHLWPFANAWSALCTLATVPGRAEVVEAAAAMLGGLMHYQRGGPAPGQEADAGGAGLPGGDGPVAFESSVVPPLGHGGDVFYDDNAWVGLALVALSDLTGDLRVLALARRVLAFVLQGWSTDPSWRLPGGIRWKPAPRHRSRNACATAPAAELAALLHLRTGDPDALSWALRIDDWMHRALVRHDGLVVDRIEPNGERDPAVWSYNQGTVIGSGLLLYRATGDRRRLERALACAAAATAHFTPEVLARQDPPFNAIYLRNLLLLDEVAPDPRRRACAVAYGDLLWQARDLRTGLLGDPRRPLNDTATLLQVSALVAGATPHP